jgi:hypothetical protein
MTTESKQQKDENQMKNGRRQKNPVRGTESEPVKMSAPVAT